MDRLIVSTVITYYYSHCISNSESLLLEVYSYLIRSVEGVCDGLEELEKECEYGHPHSY